MTHSSALREMESRSEEVYYDFRQIEKLTGRKEFFTNSATIEGSNFDELFVKSNSLVTMESCLGHFGTELNQKKLRIPLLIVTDIMLFAVEIGIKFLIGAIIPIPIHVKTLKAKIDELMAPPATVEVVVTGFRMKGNVVTAKAEARVNSRLYAEAMEFSFSLVPKKEFRRINADNENTVVQKELVKGYTEQRRLFYQGMTKLVEERAPFLNVGEIIILKSETANSHGHHWRAISIAQLSADNCYRNSIHDHAFVTPVDYSKIMALTAELLVGYLSKVNFNFPAVALAVKVKEVNASEKIFFYPPVCLITVVDITWKNISMAFRSIKKQIKFFNVDSVKIITESVDENLADMKDLSFLLIEKKSFLDS